MITCRDCKTEYEQYQKGDRKQCRTCYNDYMRGYMLARYHRRRGQAIKDLGGCCALCYSIEGLEVDHRDQFDKTYDLGKLFSSGSTKTVEEELKKCQVLCRVCHKAKTRKDLAVRFGQREYWEHGTLGGYRYCRCPECKQAKRLYGQQNRESRKGV